MSVTTVPVVESPDGEPGGLASHNDRSGAGGCPRQFVLLCGLLGGAVYLLGDVARSVIG